MKSLRGVLSEAWMEAWTRQAQVSISLCAAEKVCDGVGDLGPSR